MSKDPYASVLDDVVDWLAKARARAPQNPARHEWFVARNLTILEARVVQGRTLQDVGQEYGVAAERARQIVNKYLRLIRIGATVYDDAPPPSPPKKPDQKVRYRARQRNSLSRFSIELERKQTMALHRVIEKTGWSKASTFRKCIIVMEILVEAEENGQRLAIVDEFGHVTQLVRLV